MPKDNNDDARNFFFDVRPRKFAKKRISVESEGKKKNGSRRPLVKKL